MTESQATTKLKNALLKHGLFWKTSDRFVAGIPDIIGCVGGKFVAIEMKLDRGKPTKLQEFFLKKVSEHEGLQAVVTYKNKTRTWQIDKSKESLTIEGVVDTLIKSIYVIYP